LRPRSLLNIHIRPIPTTLELTISRNRFFASLPIIATIFVVSHCILCCFPLVSFVGFGVGAHADHSVSLCLLCRHEAGEEAFVFRINSPLTCCSIRSPGGRSPGANSPLAHVCRVGQELRFHNEEDVLFGTTVVLPRLTEAVSLSARPCTTTALPRNESP
jgi:hypothetical protein